jgi:hypothetical protein
MTMQYSLLKYRNEGSKKLTFDKFKNNLMLGREFDIVYKGEKYGISWCKDNSICFSRYNDPSFCAYFKDVSNFVDEAKIGQMDMRNIWNNVQVQTMY